MVQLIPKEVDEGKPHLSTKQIYIYIYIDIFSREGVRIQKAHHANLLISEQKEAETGAAATPVVP